MLSTVMNAKKKVPLHGTSFLLIYKPQILNKPRYTSSIFNGGNVILPSQESSNLFDLYRCQIKACAGRDSASDRTKID